MILRYGPYQFTENSVTPTFFGARTIYSERMRPVMLRRRAVFDGEILGSTSQIANRAGALETALALDGGDVVFYDPATGAGMSMLNSGSLAGVRVVERPAFTAQDGRAHWVTGIPYRIAFEADYPAATDGIVHYEETITVSGDGGVQQVCLELDTGLPEIQTVRDSTSIIVVQAGEISGFLSYAAINTPLFPQNILDPRQDKQIASIAPRLYGNTYTDFNRRWMYRMTLTAPTGIPAPLQR